MLKIVIITNYKSKKEVAKMGFFFYFCLDFPNNKFRFKKGITTYSGIITPACSVKISFNI